MPEQAGATRPVLIAAQPQVFVSDMDRACAFFTGKLGFRVVFRYGDPPFYAQVARDGAALNLRHVDEPVFDPLLRDRESLLSASLTVATAAVIEALYQEFAVSGAGFAQDLRTQPWGARDFIVRDPDGNLVHFAGPAA